MLRITVDSFSGHTNPSWIVTDDAAVKAVLREAADNRRALSKETSAQSCLGQTWAVLPEGSGYRGMVLTAEGSELLPFERVVVFGGRVWCEEAGARWNLLDCDRLFERWLLRTGKGYLDEALYRFIDQTIGI